MNKPTTAVEPTLPPWDGSVPRPVRSMWERGYSVIPQRYNDGGKIPLYPYKEWQQERPPWEVVEHWALANPDCLWAIIVPQDECRLDFDVQHGADLEWVGLTPSIWTPHGGVHVSVKVPFRVKSSQQGKISAFKGLEILGHPHLATFYGEGYEEGMGETYDLADLPSQLQQEIEQRMWTEEDRKEATLPDDFSDFTPLSDILREMVDKVNAGETRNEVGFWGFCQARDERFDIDEVRQFALEQYLPQVTALGGHPYRHGEAFESVMSAFSRPPREPRGLRSEDQLERDVAKEHYRRKVSRLGKQRDDADTAIFRSEHSRHTTGGVWLFDESSPDPAVWGDGGRILWAINQALLLVADEGLGKTTIAQQLALHLLGLSPPTFLGLSIAPLPEDQTIVYLAMDRPEQAKRSMQRMVTPEHRECLDRRFHIWSGPLPVVVSESPRTLADWLQTKFGEHGQIGAVIVDTYKDFGMPLSEDATGIAVNAAMQEVVARGIQWLGLHHPTKSGSGLGSLQDVYGSRFLTAGCGSVVALQGAASGTTQIELKQLKTVEQTVTIPLVHDHGAGRTVRRPGEGEIVALLEEADGEGVEETMICLALYGVAGDTKTKERKDTRRLLEKMEKEYGDRIRHVSGKSGGQEGGGSSARWYIKPLEVGFGEDGSVSWG